MNWRDEATLAQYLAKGGADRPEQGGDGEEGGGGGGAVKGRGEVPKIRLRGNSVGHIILRPMSKTRIPILTLSLFLAASSRSHGQQGKLSEGVGTAHEVDIRVGTPSTPAAVAIRQIDAPCRSVEESAIRFFEDHGFYAKSATKGNDITVALGLHTKVSTPSAKQLSLNRISIHKYTLPRHLSPFKAYDFHLEGSLQLVKATDESCNASLSFDFSAFEWVWALAVIDDGVQSTLTSNGSLERMYIDSIGDLLRRERALSRA